MKLKNKRLLSYIMVFGDFFMAMVGLILLFDEDFFILGLLMLGFLAIDIYLTFDYIKALAHREKVEKSLQADNERARTLRRQWNRMDTSQRPGPQPGTYRPAQQRPAQPRPAPQPQPQQRPAPQPAPQQAVWVEEEPDFSDILSSDDQNMNQSSHG